MKRIINNLLRPTGYKFAKVVDNYQKVKFNWLEHYGIKTIFDVGANEGQFALEIRKWLPDAKIYSFEPLLDTYGILTSNISNHPNMRAFNVALADYNGKSKIFKNEYTPSSSLLELGTKHIEAYPENDKVSSEEITVNTLDDFVEQQKVEIHRNVLLKIDVQGFEDKVVKGALKTLGVVKIVFVEVSFWELYKNQALFDQIYQLLKDSGFTYRGNYDVSFNKETGLPIFSDGIFIK